MGEIKYSNAPEGVLAEITEKVGIAVRKGDFDEVVRLAKTAKEWEALVSLERQTNERKKGLIASLELGIDGSGRAQYQVELPTFDQHLTGKQWGKQSCARFVQRLANCNIALRRLAGNKYQTSAGRKVGIASAREGSTRADSWFLGLPDERPDVAVLLCETSDGRVLDFIFPPKFVT